MKAIRFVFGWISLVASCVRRFCGAAPLALFRRCTPAVAASPRLCRRSLENGYLKLGFDQLASFFSPPAFDAAAKKTPLPTGEEQIPAAVKEWNGKKADVTGFMVPVKMEKGLATEFLVMRNTIACCYGCMPDMTEWVIVKMKKGGSGDDGCARDIFRGSQGRRDFRERLPQRHLPARLRADGRSEELSGTADFARENFAAEIVGFWILRRASQPHERYAQTPASSSTDRMASARNIALGEHLETVGPSDCAATSASSTLIASADLPSGRLMKL